MSARPSRWAWMSSPTSSAPLRTAGAISAAVRARRSPATSPPLRTQDARQLLGSGARRDRVGDLALRPLGVLRDLEDRGAVGGGDHADAGVVGDDDVPG